MSAPHRGKLLNIKQASAYSGLSVRLLRELANSQRIAHVRQGAGVARGRRAPNGQVYDCAVGRLMFCEQDLDDYIDQQRVAPKAETANPRDEAQPSPVNPLAAYLPPSSERRYS